MKEFKPQLFSQIRPNDLHQVSAIKRYGDWVRLAKHVGFFELVLWFLAPTDGTTLTITEEGKPYICLWDLSPDKFMDLWMKGDPDLPKHLVDKESVADITNTYKTIFKLQMRAAAKALGTDGAQRNFDLMAEDMFPLGTQYAHERGIVRKQIIGQRAAELSDKVGSQTDAMVTVYIGDEIFDLPAVIDSFTKDHIETVVIPFPGGYGSTGIHKVHMPAEHTLITDDRSIGMEIKAHGIADAGGKKCNLLIQDVWLGKTTPPEALAALLKGEKVDGFYLFSDLVQGAMQGMNGETVSLKHDGAIYVVDSDRKTIWRLCGTGGICLKF